MTDEAEKFRVLGRAMSEASFQGQAYRESVRTLGIANAEALSPCCDDMAESLQSYDGVGQDMSGDYRFYAEGQHIGGALRFCPYCGTKLPEGGP